MNSKPMWTTQESVDSQGSEQDDQGYQDHILEVKRNPMEEDEKRAVEYLE